MLSGISPDPRGNGTMRATCVQIGEEPASTPALTETTPLGPPNPNPLAGPPPGNDDELLSAAQEARQTQ